MPVTIKQQKFIESLLIDCSLTTIKLRNAWLSRECGRDIKFIDQLTLQEGSEVIEKLLDLRDRRGPATPKSVDDDGDKDWNRR